MSVQIYPRPLDSAFLLVVFWFASVLFPSTAIAAPAITLSKKIGPPTSQILVSGGGFSPNARVDIYFDTKDEASVVTDQQGEFHNAAISAPREAKPGKHWITALERDNGKGAQDPFVVNTNWPQFLHDNAHTGDDLYENVLNAKNISGLSLKWTRPASTIGSSVAVVNGVLYASGCTVGAFCAFNATTGRSVWKYQAQGAIYSSPTVVNNVVYFGTDAGYVYALNASDGTLLWSYVASSLVRSSPTVSDGTVYFGSFDGNFFALDASTGTPIWTFPTGNAIESTPAVVNGTVYFGDDGGAFYAMDAKTGNILWTFIALSSVASAPAVSNGVVYFGSYDRNLYALDVSRGSRLWSFKTGQMIDSSPVVADGVVYLAASDQNLYALNASTGDIVWTVLVGPTTVSPALANGVVYTRGQTSLNALDAATGALLWTYANAASNGSSPAVANGMLFLESEFDVLAFGLSGAEPASAANSRPPEPKTLHPDR
jgi:outer membrane protein assembly factor BamB